VQRPQHGVSACQLLTGHNQAFAFRFNPPCAFCTLQPNGAGKSTLMRAIANGQLDGFPPKSELRTVYVEHDIDASGGCAAVPAWQHRAAILSPWHLPPIPQAFKLIKLLGAPQRRRPPWWSLW
jgi:hypothetical protein